MKQIEITDYSLESYQKFLATKKAAIHRVIGNTIHVEDFAGNDTSQSIEISPYLFDYQQFIVRLCLAKQRFAIFADIGLGKTAMFLEWVRHVSKAIYPKKTLIITQLHLITQTLMGIGSEGVVAVKLGRRFTGIELKEEYFRMAAKNISMEEADKGRQISMFG